MNRMVLTAALAGRVATLTLILGTTVLGQGKTTVPAWLDRPLANWNKPGASVPRATPPDDETIDELTKRCNTPIRRGTAGERALADAGWLPFHLFDRQIVEGDVEILGAMADADGMCRPAEFNVFVFVGGQMAGTLSPGSMVSRTDGTVGVVRLAPDGSIAAQFERYTDKDPLCCPSGRVTVRYRIDRTSKSAVVVPLNVQTARP